MLLRYADVNGMGEHSRIFASVSLLYRLVRLRQPYTMHGMDASQFCKSHQGNVESKKTLVLVRKLLMDTSISAIINGIIAVDARGERSDDTARQKDGAGSLPHSDRFVRRNPRYDPDRSIDRMELSRYCIITLTQTALTFAGSFKKPLRARLP
ncbi:expressed unknown protein [Seminavis robusta]|uniref:Uncharacterized protein n=1 Tax=Seminavis robusta TaxID=568900 RepID=A0A9N8EHF8_9STRA|nr:expressed unknown protein [Seminavis robusta]|eukprot:Sro943_g222741.1  (153) ;mRNA; f:1833-2291